MPNGADATDQFARPAYVNLSVTSPPRPDSETMPPQFVTINLVKALAERMSQTDFSTWQQSGGRDTTTLYQPSGSQDFFVCRGTTRWFSTACQSTFE
jgi:hypothetical protein